MKKIYRFERLNSTTNEWEFVSFVQNKNMACCSTHERVISV